MLYKSRHSIFFLGGGGGGGYLLLGFFIQFLEPLPKVLVIH